MRMTSSANSRGFIRGILIRVVAGKDILEERPNQLTEVLKPEPQTECHGFGRFMLRAVGFKVQLIAPKHVMTGLRYIVFPFPHAFAPKRSYRQKT
jgi:hypothetical protein